MTHLHGQGAGEPTPRTRKDEGPARNRPPSEQNNEHLDSDGITPEAQTAIRAEIEAQDFRFRAVHVELARIGFGLFIADVGHGHPGYLIQRWGRSRELADLAAVEAFMTAVRGASPTGHSQPEDAGKATSSPVASRSAPVPAPAQPQAAGDAEVAASEGGAPWASTS